MYNGSEMVIGIIPNGLCYTSRLYNKTLSSDEISQNATKTMVYHNALGK